MEKYMMKTSISKEGLTGNNGWNKFNSQYAVKFIKSAEHKRAG